ncbi:DNA repair protein complementing XP-C cells homolog isoform X2 [Ochlerotatus camptorhynchus]|uniref:DNA repair protein complementing XP-C cells homolog isoform X2 n=1 Tax=Ochlerotatus camptorhynchus TaxID=644619 RepID=UPI0031DCE77C
MSKKFMTDSEEEDADFSASEDEWLPENDKPGRGSKTALGKGSSSGASESDDGESDEGGEPKGGGRRSQAQKGQATDARKSRAPPKPKLSTSERKKLYEKYRPSAGSKVGTKQEGDDSDSSGDEHLVNPEQLDLNSDFFIEPPAEKPAEEVLQFDCNAGVQLSDSSEEEGSDQGEPSEQGEDAKRQANKKLIAKINQKSQSFVNFEGLQHLNEKIDQAKEQLALFKAKESTSDGLVNIGDLLALGEHHEEKPPTRKTGKSKPLKKKKEEDSDSDWEEVEEKEENQPLHDVQITLDVGPTSVQRKKRSNEIDIEACIKRIVNREKRENQIVLHKVNIVMAIAHGNFVNGALNNSKLLSLALTLIPSQKCYPKDRTNLEYFEQITKFFKEIVDLKERRMFCRFKKLPSLETSLRLQMLTKAAICKRDYILIFIILLRAIGVQCRMVMSLAVVPKKLPQSELQQTQVTVVKKAKKDIDSEAKSTATSISKGSKKKSTKEDHDYADDGNSGAKKERSKRKAATGSALKVPQLDGNDDSCGGVPSKKSKLAPSTGQADSSKDKPSPGPSTSKAAIPKLQEVSVFSPRKTRKQRQEQANGSPSFSEISKPNNPKRNSNPPVVAVPSTTSSILIRKDYKDKPVKNIIDKKKTSTKGVKPSNTTAINSKVNQSNTQTKNATPKATKPKPEPVKAPTVEKSKSKCKESPKVLKVEIFDKKLKKRLDRRVLSTDDEFRKDPDNKTKLKSGVNLWIEVYAEEEEQWVPLDAVGSKVHCLEHIVKQASSPLVYILAWNNDGTIKDVSPRYCPNYATSTKKLRIEQEWLDETLAKFKGKRTAKDIEEDRSLNQALMEQPLPTTISEFKNNPLYALKRHLLKFEGIYPPDAPTLGFIKDEPVYARECVQTLHSREIWLKQARTVKMFETAYKVVNARPKYDRASSQMLPAQPLELFGYWQTQDYEPPTAEDGIVPRNAYGNVELFKPCMLPKKTVHLQLPSLNRICKKLGIDCAQAVTGFDFHGGCSHPVYDGFVVCEEFKDLVVDAWYQEQEQEEKRERDKYEKRVYGNWKKLIKGLLIRRKLQNKYNFDNLTG